MLTLCQVPIVCIEALFFLLFSQSIFAGCLTGTEVNTGWTLTGINMLELGVLVCFGKKVISLMKGSVQVL